MDSTYLGTLRRQAIDLCRVQPPDTENRMSGGVEGLRGEILVAPSDPFSISKTFYPPGLLRRAVQ